MVFSILPFGNHVKKFGSNFYKEFSFPFESNLCFTQCMDCSLMGVLMSLDQKDFKIITVNAVSMPQCLMSMGIPFLFQN